MDELKGIDRFIESRLKDFKAPGIALAVVKGNRTIFSNGYGKRNVEQDLPLTASSPIPIGSCTKAFTATAVGILVDEGKLEWDRPIREYLPKFRMFDPVAQERTTLRDCLAHRTGIYGHGNMVYTAPLTRWDLVKRLRYLQPYKEFRSGFAYNNFMYAVVGCVMEQVTGMTWEENVRKRILEPLRMEHTAFINEVSIKSDEMTVGYRELRERLVPALSLYEGDVDLAAAYGDTAMMSGGIVSTVEDLCRWNRFQLNRGKVGKRRVVSEKTFKEIHNPQMAVPQPSGWNWNHFGSEMLDASYALGWWVQPYRGYQTIFHAGGGWGYGTFVAMIPSQSIGVVLIQNAYSSLGKVVVLNLLDRMLGLPPAPWSARLKRVMRERDDRRKRRAQKKPAPAPKRRPMSLRRMKDYIGVYQHPAYGPLHIVLEEEQLKLRLNEFIFRMQPTQKDAFILVRIAGDIFKRMKVEFERDSEGKIESVSAPFPIDQPSIVFQKKEQPMRCP